MPDRSQYHCPLGLEDRVRAMEIQSEGVRVWKDNLTIATQSNTDAIKDLTQMIGKVSNILSYNKGAFWMAFKFASIGVAFTSAVFGFATWLYSIFHIVPPK